MKSNLHSIRCTSRPRALATRFVFVFSGLMLVRLAAAALAPLAAPNGSVIVQSMFGGQIFGFDIDQTGNEGVLTEAQTLPGGKVLAAIETFDQTTGAIIKVVRQTQSHDDFVTLGVFAPSAGLVEREHVVSNVSRNQGNETVAVFVQDNTGNFQPTVFSSNVAANTFGPVATIIDEDFSNGLPAFAFDSATNQAVLGAPKLGNPFVPGRIATIDLATGAFTKFTSVGLGDVNGLAVDPATGTACTTTEIDFSVEFYNLATHAGTKQTLPNAPNQFYSGSDVQFDPVNQLFLVAQCHSSTASSGSSIHVYDVAGNLVESINGLNFSNAGNVVPAHLALHPNRRIGFVDGPDPGVTQIQSFSY